MSTPSKPITRDTIVYPRDVISHGSDGVQVLRGEFRGFTKVAVKRILRSDDVKIIDEVNLLRENVHENIVKYFDYGSDDSFYYIAMEYCPGTLESLVSKEYTGPSPGDSIVVLHQITAGLAHLHSKKIVHRDLKPQNLLISSNNPPKMKLADFGISKRQKREYYFSNTGTYGTVGWAAPELMKEDTERFSLSIDIFSLGCIFGYVFTGHHPFGGVLERTANIIKDKRSWTNKEKLSKTWKLLIKEMISNNPKKRPTVEKVQKHFQRLSRPQTTSSPSNHSRPPSQVTVENIATPTTSRMANSLITVQSRSPSAVNACTNAIRNIERHQNLLSPTSPSYFKFSTAHPNGPKIPPTNHNPSSTMSANTGGSFWRGPQYSSLRVSLSPVPKRNETSGSAANGQLERTYSMRVSNQSYASVTTVANRKLSAPDRNSSNTSRDSSEPKPSISSSQQSSSVSSLVKQFEASSQTIEPNDSPKSRRKN